MDYASMAKMAMSMMDKKDEGPKRDDYEKAYGAKHDDGSWAKIMAAMGGQPSQNHRPDAAQNATTYHTGHYAKFDDDAAMRAYGQPAMQPVTMQPPASAAPQQPAPLSPYGWGAAATAPAQAPDEWWKKPTAGWKG